MAEDRRIARMHRWGLMPAWAKGDFLTYKLINARAETLTEKPSYRKAFESRRCLVPADGFYEWIKEGLLKIPIRFVLKSRETFAFAGLWEKWRNPDGEELYSFTIITTNANDMVKPVHGRMPVILRREDESAWIDPALTDTDELKKFLMPYPPHLMAAYKVSTMVNSAENDKPECIKPVKAGIWEPDHFEASIGGFMGSSYSVRWDWMGRLRYQPYELHYEKQAAKEVNPSQEGWEKFWAEMDRIKIWNWRDEYKSKQEVRDGTGWHVDIRYNNNFVESSGSNAYPKYFKPFCQAVARLLDGLAFE